MPQAGMTSGLFVRSELQQFWIHLKRGDPFQSLQLACTQTHARYLCAAIWKHVAYVRVRKCEMTFSMKHRGKKKTTHHAAIKKHRLDVQDIGVIFDAISDSSARWKAKLEASALPTLRTGENHL